MHIFSRIAPTHAKKVKINKADPDVRIRIAGSVINRPKSDIATSFSMQAYTPSKTNPRPNNLKCK